MMDFFSKINSSVAKSVSHCSSPSFCLYKLHFWIFLYGFPIDNRRHTYIYIYVTEHAKRAQLMFKIILSFRAKLRLRSILGKTFLAAIQYLQQFTYLCMKF